MSADFREPQMKTVTTLVAGVLSDLQLLVEQQFQLAKCEIEMELRQRLTATLILGTGLAGLLIGGFMLSPRLRLIHFTGCSHPQVQTPHDCRSGSVKYWLLCLSEESARSLQISADDVC